MILKKTKSAIISIPILVFVLVALINTTSLSGSENNPKLVLFIAIDGFRFDYLERFNDYFSEEGFVFLQKNAAVFDNAHIAHYRPVTGPGHATMLSGASGRINGIIANSWWDRSLREEINCVEDQNVTILDGEPQNVRYAKKAGRSPLNMLVSTVGDQLKLTNQFKSKVIGLSVKDRAAILPAGKLADLACWFDDTSGKFISSNYYSESLPEWLVVFNNKKITDQYFGRKWEKVLPEEAYQLSREDDFAHELDYKGIGITFPHTINGGKKTIGQDFYKAMAYSPFTDEILAMLAKTAIEHENLGGNDVTDILTIGFSATDRVGHHFGPYSQEMQDQVIRLDRILADLFKFLEEKIGLENIIITLTADHGCAPIPEYMAKLGFDAGRVDTTAVPDDRDSIIIPATVDAALDQEFGSANWIEAFIEPNVYFDYEVLAENNVALSDIEKAAQQALHKLRGIDFVFTRTELLSGNFSDDSVSKKVIRQFNAHCSGDLVVVNEPYYITAGFKGSLDKGTHHISYSHFDTHIPVIFYGKKFRSGRYKMPVILNDMAPTISSVLGISYPSGSEGRVLYEVMIN